MFNPRPQVSRIAIGESDIAVVIDGVLAEPGALVELAVRHREAFTPAATNAFPGLELPLPDAAVERFAECFSQHARSAVGARRVLSATGRLSMVTHGPSQLSPMQRLCHRDRLAAQPDQCVGAAVLYLFRDPALGGTNIFRSRHAADDTDALMRRFSTLDNAAFSAETGWAPGYMTQSNQHFERVAAIEPRWNRMICYDGSLFHGSHIEQPERLSDDPSIGRLTLNLFFLCKRQAS